jgi:hypothetical protein
MQRKKIERRRKRRDDVILSPKRKQTNTNRCQNENEGERETLQMMTRAMDSSYLFVEIMNVARKKINKISTYTLRHNTYKIKSYHTIRETGLSRGFRR